MLSAAHCFCEIAKCVRKKRGGLKSTLDLNHNMRMVLALNDIDRKGPDSVKKADRIFLHPKYVLFMIIFPLF